MLDRKLSFVIAVANDGAPLHTHTHRQRIKLKSNYSASYLVQTSTALLLVRPESGLFA